MPPPPAAGDTRASMRGLMGSFGVLPLADLVELLARRKATGTLSCERGTASNAPHSRSMSSPYRRRALLSRRAGSAM